jgi:hypothetical protein
MAMSSADGGESFLDRFKNMDKNKRNNLILIVGLPLAAILVILFTPRSNSKEEKNTDQQNEVQNDGSQNQTESPEVDSVSEKRFENNRKGEPGASLVSHGISTAGGIAPESSGTPSDQRPFSPAIH